MINPINTTYNIPNIKSAKESAESIKTDEFQKLLENAKANQDKEKLKEACKQFEAVLLNMMMKSMRNTIPKSDFMSKSMAEESFTDMLYDNYANEISKGQGIGLADILYKDLTKTFKKEE